MLLEPPPAKRAGQSQKARKKCFDVCEYRYRFERMAANCTNSARALT
jgi:hypothetical protein